MDPMDHICTRSIGAARRLRAGKALRVAFVSCSYDTAFESVADQVEEKIRQLRAGFGLNTEVHWSFWVVDDLPPEAGFTQAVEQGFGRTAPALGVGERLFCIPMTSQPRRPGGLKGRALLDGMAAALAWEPQVVVYLNLNLKVDARFAAPGIEAVADESVDVAVGSRARVDGGLVRGAGALGRLKSRVYSRIARTALPSLKAYVDTNAPVKVFSPGAAQHLVNHARLDDVTLDCEWLLLAQTAGFRMGRFPIAWIQRAGSRPPWHLVVLSVRDVMRLRHRWSTRDMPQRTTEP